MYLVRRTWRVPEPRNTRLAATVVAAIGENYEQSGQRTPTRVFFNSGTTPGDKGTVSMEWAAEVLESPYRGDNTFPEDPKGNNARLRELTSESWIEFFELMTPDKAVDLDA